MMSDSKIRKDGITVLPYAADINEPPQVDIVFVHGLGGGAKKTWTSKSSDGSPVYWPRDHLSGDFKHARILTFGYDSHVFRWAANQNGINEHARSLLHSLDGERREEGEHRRPIIFLVHSLGGLVLKQMLIMSKTSSRDDLRSIYTSTYAIIFFGTPHRGSSYANLGEVYRKCRNRSLPYLWTTNTKLLVELSPNSTLLGMIRDGFGDMIREKAFETYNFQEGRPYKIYGKIVDDDSSSMDMDGMNKDVINKDHKKMCQFRDADDEGYRKVKRVISRYFRQLDMAAYEARQKLNAAEEAVIAECINSLEYPMDLDIYDNIQQADPFTSEWIFSDPATGFTEWLRGGDGLFWIRGKPGSGKSTLLKYVYEDDRTIEILNTRWKTGVATGKYFFREQSKSNTKKSYHGLLQAILFRILKFVPQLFRYIKDIYQHMKVEGHWTQILLTKALIKVTSQKDISGCICMFIDALDEYPGARKDCALDIIRLIQSTKDGAFKLKICASSRPVGDFKAIFKSVPGILIQNWTTNDIKTLVDNRIQEANRGKMPLLSEEIASMANGSFLWVRLLLKSLWIHMLDYEAEKDLLSKVYEFPADLDTFYESLIRNLPMELKPKIMMILTLVCTTCNYDRLPSLAEICLAMELPEDGHEPFELGLLPQDDVRRCRQMEHRLDTHLSAFVEVFKPITLVWTPNKRIYAPLTLEEYQLVTSNIQFTHKTAKDYMVGILQSSTISGEHYLRAGHLRFCQLYTHLAKMKSGLYYMLPTNSLRPDETDFNCYDTDLVLYFTFHARELEYRDWIQISGEPESCHDFREADTHITEWTNRRHPYPKTTTGHLTHIPNQERQALVDTFHKAMTSVGGEVWYQDWADSTLYNLKGLQLPSFLAFAILNGLFLYAMDVLETQEDSLPPLNSHEPSLLYWSHASSTFIEEHSLLDLFRDESTRSNHFTQYLLTQKAANPNSTFTTPFKQRRPPLTPLPPTIQDRSGITTISLLHACLGTVLTSGFPKEITLAALETMCLLLTAGASPGGADLENYWLLRDEPSKRSVIHYLTNPVNYGNLVKDHIVKDFTPFDLPDAGPLLCRTIRLLFKNGADPNAIDSAGIHVLTAIAGSRCPDEVVVWALVAGGKIQVEMVGEERGSVFSGRDFLKEKKWLKKRYYTEEAWEKVTSLGFVDGVEHKEQEGEDDIGDINAAAHLTLGEGTAVIDEEVKAKETDVDMVKQANPGLKVTALISWTRIYSFLGSR